MKNTSENISSKMANDLIEMEKSSVNRIVGLETAVSKYHEQILENNNNIRDIQPKLQDISNSMDTIKTNVSSNSALLSSLEPRVKGNEDNIKHIDDTLDSLKTSLNSFASKQVEDAEKTSQLNVLINNTQLQLKEQENKLVEQSNSDLNLIKNQINDLENQTGVSQQKIVELDNGSQALLEKILGLENGVNDKIGTLNEKDNALQNEIEGLKSISQSNSDGIQKEVNGKLVELKEEYIATTNSLRTETQTLTQSLQESKSQQVSIEKRVNEIDSGNQQLLEKILAVEQDLEGKVQGINSNSSNISDKIMSLEDETKSHSQSLVTIQESMAIQVDNMKKVDSERQNAAARAKEDLDVANAANAKAIDDKLQAMNRDLEEKLNDAKKKVEKNADDIAGQNNLLKEHNDSINGNMTSITSLSNKLAASEKDIDSLQKQVSSNTEDIDSLKEKVKLNQDHLKTVDDTLDGLHKSNEMFEGRHVETVEKMKEVAVLASSVQSQVREQEEKIVEQSTNNLNVINEQIKNLENQQGVSVQKISELDNGAQLLLEKFLSADAKFEDINKDIKILTEAKNRHTQIMHSVEVINDNINNIDEKQAKMRLDLEKLGTSVDCHNEKILSLEDMNIIQAEKAKFVESLNERVSKFDEIRQQSEVRAKEEMDTKDEKFSKELTDLKAKFNENADAISTIMPRMDNIEIKLTENMETVSEKIRNASKETNVVINKLSEEFKASTLSTDEKIISIKTNIESLQSEFDAGLNDHDQKLKKLLSATEEHSNFFTTITANISNIENTMSSYDSKQKAVTENLLVTSEAQLTEFRNKFDSRISEIMRRMDDHSDKFDQNELNLVDLKRKLDENYLHTQRDLEELRKKCGNDKEFVVMKINETKETVESVFNSLEEKIELLETTQIKEVIFYSERCFLIQKKTCNLMCFEFRF